MKCTGDDELCHHTVQKEPFPLLSLNALQYGLNYFQAGVAGEFEVFCHISRATLVGQEIWTLGVGVSVGP